MMASRYGTSSAGTKPFVELKSHGRENASAVGWFFRLWFALLIGPFGLADVSADSCIWSESETGASTNKRFHVTVHRSPNSGWAFRWTDGQTGRTHTGPVGGLEEHAHPQVFVSADGGRFVVVDLSAGHRFNDRVMVYRPDGRLIRSLGVDDILLFHQRSHVSMSISHLSWTSYDRASNRWVWLEDEGNRLFLVSPDELRIAVSLQNGDVIREPWVMNLIPWVPSAWFGIAALLLTARVAFSKRSIVKRFRVPIDLSMIAALMIGTLIRVAWHDTSIPYFFPQTSVYSVAMFTALLGALLFWGMIGSTRWPLRLPATIAGIAALLTTFALIWATNDFFTTTLLCGMLSAMVLISILLVLTGFRLRRSSEKVMGGQTAVSNEHRSSHLGSGALLARSSQFRLGDLLVWMMAVAVLITVTRFVPWKTFPGGFQWMPFAAGAIYALVAMSVLFVTMTRSRLAWIGGMLLFAGGLAISMSAQRRWGVTFSWRLLVCYTGSLFSIMLVYRLHGFHLRRRASVGAG